MNSTINPLRPLTVQVVGAIDHPDFRDAAALIHKTAVCDDEPIAAPEVVFVAQARPGLYSRREVESLQRCWPLAGFVTIAGSWCEGEIRTGRPWPGVKRFYWYEFPAWWRQQLTLRSAGVCPEWARPTLESYRTASVRNPKSTFDGQRQGAIRISTANRDTAEALTEVLQRAGYATVWDPPGRLRTVVCGTVAGVWDGRQLDEFEESDLTAFCRSLARDAAPVVAMLDFPRRDRCQFVERLGVATVLGKPWINADLVATMDEIVSRNADVRAMNARAA